MALEGTNDQSSPPLFKPSLAGTQRSRLIRHSPLMDAVSVTHALVLIAQVAAGLAWSDAPALWLRSYIELALGLCASLVLLASAADAAFSRFRRLQARAPPDAAKRMAEAAESCRAMLVFSGFAAWPRTLLALGHPTALRWTLALGWFAWLAKGASRCSGELLGELDKAISAFSSEDGNRMLGLLVQKAFRTEGITR